jgi:heme/copper-type cytochrome/quinol oxidase subunit 2
VNGFMGMLLCLSAFVAAAADAPNPAEAVEPTVSGFWIAVFLVVFLVVCVWFAIAVWRAERKSQASKEI